LRFRWQNESSRVPALPISESTPGFSKDVGVRLSALWAGCIGLVTKCNRRDLRFC